MIGKIQLRFLDPSLARRYDSDGMATALFTTVGACYRKKGLSSAWPKTILVPSNAIDRLRKIVRALMDFECQDDFERKEVIPQLVATASFFCRAKPKGRAKKKNEAIPEDERPKIPLESPEDIRRVLLGLRPGDDLKIWIETTTPPPGIRSQTSRGKENSHPNHPPKNPASKPETPTPPGKPPFSMVSEDATVGRISPVTESPSLASSIETTTAHPSASALDARASEAVWNNGAGEIGHTDDDKESRLLLALAGCDRGKGPAASEDFCVSDHDEHDGLLSGLLICDDGYASDETSHLLFPSDHHSASSVLTYSSSHSMMSYHLLYGAGTSKAASVRDSSVQNNANEIAAATSQHHHPHLTPSFFETQVSLCSVSSRASSSEPVQFGDAPWGDGVPRLVSHTGAMGTGSCHSWSSSSALSSSSSSRSISSNTSNSSGSRGGLARSVTDKVTLESSSLSQGPEREMITILESVLDSLFVPDHHHPHRDDEMVGGTHEKAILRTGGRKETHPGSVPFPCPTPRELLGVECHGT